MTFAWVLAVGVLGACGTGDSAADWREAQAMWERREMGAYAAWSAIDPDSSEGREARVRLGLADAAYREGVSRLEADGEGAREALERGVAIAPMNPELYLRMGRACRARGLNTRAAEYFTKYLAALPGSRDAEQVRAELSDLDPELAGVFRPAAVPEAPSATGEYAPAELRLLALGAVFGLLLAFTLALAWRVWRQRGVSLARLARDRPELHPAIAYLVGSLRHELLKHRIGAARDALLALRAGSPGGPQLDFLRGRLYGGQPLGEAWRGYLEAFERAFGGLDLRRDRDFRSADRQIRKVAALETRLARGEPRAVEALAAAQGELSAFDAKLHTLVSGLVRTRVDDDLLREIVSEVQSEYAVSLVELESLTVEPVAEPVEVEVFRVDLVLVLKNILRNAILATGRSGTPGRVGLDVSVELEPTGEETVRLRVSDTNAESLRAESMLDRRVDRGLGLVAAAVTRYGGAIEVEPGSRGFSKAVVVWFFRAFDDEDTANEYGGIEADDEVESLRCAG